MGQCISSTLCFALICGVCLESMEDQNSSERAIISWSWRLNKMTYHDPFHIRNLFHSSWILKDRMNSPKTCPFGLTDQDSLLGKSRAGLSSSANWDEKQETSLTLCRDLVFLKLCVGILFQYVHEPQHHLENRSAHGNLKHRDYEWGQKGMTWVGFRLHTHHHEEKSEK